MLRGDLKGLLDIAINHSSAKPFLSGNLLLLIYCLCLLTEVLLSELSLGLGSVHSVTGDGRKFLTAVVLVVDIIGDIL